MSYRLACNNLWPPAATTITAINMATIIATAAAAMLPRACRYPCRPLPAWAAARCAAASTAAAAPPQTWATARCFATTTPSSSSTSPTPPSYVPPPSWSIRATLDAAAAAAAATPLVSEAVLDRMAELSHLNLAGQDRAALRRDLAGLLATAEALAAAAPPPGVTTSAATAAATTSNPAAAREADLRPDAVTAGGHGDRLLASAARTDGRYFVVPKVVEE